MSAGGKVRLSFESVAVGGVDEALEGGLKLDDLDLKRADLRLRELASLRRSPFEALDFDDPHPKTLDDSFRVGQSGAEVLDLSVVEGATCGSGEGAFELDDLGLRFLERSIEVHEFLLVLGSDALELGLLRSQDVERDVGSGEVNDGDLEGLDPVFRRLDELREVVSLAGEGGGALRERFHRRGDVVPLRLKEGDPLLGRLEIGNEGLALLLEKLLRYDDLREGSAFLFERGDLLLDDLEALNERIPLLLDPGERSNSRRALLIEHDDLVLGDLEGLSETIAFLPEFRRLRRRRRGALLFLLELGDTLLGDFEQAEERSALLLESLFRGFGLSEGSDGSGEFSGVRGSGDGEMGGELGEVGFFSREVGAELNEGGVDGFVLGAKGAHLVLEDRVLSPVQDSKVSLVAEREAEERARTWTT